MKQTRCHIAGQEHERLSPTIHEDRRLDNSRRRWPKRSHHSPMTRHCACRNHVIMLLFQAQCYCLLCGTLQSSIDAVSTKQTQDNGHSNTNTQTRNAVKMQRYRMSEKGIKHRTPVKHLTNFPWSVLDDASSLLWYDCFWSRQGWLAFASTPSPQSSPLEQVLCASWASFCMDLHNIRMIIDRSTAIEGCLA